MNNTTFYIDGDERSFSIENSPEFKFGDNEILSTKDTDITFGQPWYEEGFAELDSLTKEEFTSLQTGLLVAIKRIIERETTINTEGLTLENYHTFISSDADHHKVVSKTRDLFSDDFNFPILDLLPRLEEKLGFKLTDIYPGTNDKLHIIVRINRPKSKDYNPPHKDIYESVDDFSKIPMIVNFWIPVAGVTANSALPIAPKSHTLNENLILRTFDGGMVEGNKYRVRMIKSWNGENTLERSKVKYGQVLIFSSHLIHGLAVNDEADMTRVALEFRLFKND